MKLKKSLNHVAKSSKERLPASYYEKRRGWTKMLVAYSSDESLKKERPERLLPIKTKRQSHAPRITATYESDYIKEEPTLLKPDIAFTETAQKMTRRDQFRKELKERLQRKEDWLEKVLD
jgi:hypothetical protein